MPVPRKSCGILHTIEHETQTQMQMRIDDIRSIPSRWDEPGLQVEKGVEDMSARERKHASARARIYLFGHVRVQRPYKCVSGMRSQIATVIFVLDSRAQERVLHAILQRTLYL